MTGLRAALIGCALVLPGPAFGQQASDTETTGQAAPVSGAALTSPVPKVRVERPPVGQSDDEAQAPVGDPAQTATQAPSGESAQSATQEDADPPGDAAQVRVVYGSGQPADGTRPERQRVPETPIDQGADQTAAADEDIDPSEPAWKRERAKRFRRAPVRQRPEGHQVTAPIVPIETPSTELMTGARLRQLDKMTGETETFDMRVGEVRQIARLRVRLDACRAPGDNDTHGTMAYLNIWDMKRPDDPASFKGWMFAGSPALSALDHPRYDLWVISCTTSAG